MAIGLRNEFIDEKFAGDGEGFIDGQKRGRVDLARLVRAAPFLDRADEFAIGVGHAKCSAIKNERGHGEDETDHGQADQEICDGEHLFT
jgi:hypothetical protein